MKNIFILDYGLGNIASVKKAINKLGYNSIVSDQISLNKKYDCIVLPGVGSFKTAMENIKKKNSDFILKELVIKKNQKILGICLGMQLLADYGDEPILNKGMGFINGHVKKMNLKPNRLPHVGWNSVIVKNKDFKSFENKDFYFIHSYSFEVRHKSDVMMCVKVDDNEFVAAVQKDNIYGTQFHPEKSQDFGLDLLKKILDA